MAKKNQMGDSRQFSIDFNGISSPAKSKHAPSATIIRFSKNKSGTQSTTSSSEVLDKLLRKAKRLSW